MSVYFENDQQTILVRGKTYPYRDLMRSLGGQYQATDKIWTLPCNAENLLKITELCQSVGGGRTRDPPPTPPSSPSAPADTSAEPRLERDGMSISELMKKAQLMITQAFPRSVWVLGEIQNFRHHASGIYFQLADFKEGASRSASLTINATLWRSQLAELERKLGPEPVRELLQDGMRVRLLVDVTLYKDKAQLSLQVQGLDPNFTKGSLALAREKLLRELRSKGLDRRNKALSLTAFPLLIGLISAPESRAQSDFLDQLRVYAYPGRVIFFPAQMQGEKTLIEVVRGLEALTEAACDLIVLTRGGGSAADLRWFDSPEIAYAIAQCSIPIVAAIGHHDDVCIAEEISFQREKTPTAAADFIVAHFQRTRERLDQFSLALSHQLSERMRLQNAWLQSLREKILMQSQRVINSYHQHHFQMESALDARVQRRFLGAHTRLQQLNQQLLQGLQLRLQRTVSRREQLAASLLAVAQQRLQRAQQQLPQLAQQLAGQAQRATFQRDRQLHELEKTLVQRDPLPWMAQGWTQLSQESGRILLGSELNSGMLIKARLPDARLHLRVEEILFTSKDPE